MRSWAASSSSWSASTVRSTSASPAPSSRRRRAVWAACARASSSRSWPCTPSTSRPIGLGSLGDGRDFLAGELDHWTNEMNRVKRGPLPALERVAAELKAQMPEQSDRITLVHGDAKPGNFAFVGDEVNAIYDWEMADVGDPLCDLGYIELLWQMPVSINSGPSSPTVDELAARYEELSGIPVHDRAWYRAFQTFKISIIQLVGAMLLDAGYSDDPRFAMMAEGTLLMTPMALHDLGVDEEIEPGPVRPREERLIEVLGQSFWTE